jgi:hypothetical protein
LNYHQQAFIDAFKAWDANGMARALIEIVQVLADTVCKDETKDEIIWSCREFLERMEQHPEIGSLIRVPEGPFTIVLNGGVQWSSSSSPSRHPQVTLELALGANESVALKDRWNQFDFVGEEIAIRRNEVSTPAPLQGEAGFRGNQSQKPSVDAPKRGLKAPAIQTYAHALAARAEGPNTFLKRYEAGECEQVWAELLALRGKVREEAVLADAVAVARETMRRCRINIERFVSRLRELGYEFQYADEAFVPPDTEVLKQISEIESRVGPIPLSLCAWFEIVGSVNFMGKQTEWSEDEFGPYPDPMVISPSNYILKYEEANWYREQYRLEIAPDQYAKEDVSGGPPYTILVPNSDIDAPFENESHKITFVDYLRICVRSGGFPGSPWGGLTEDLLPV